MAAYEDFEFFRSESAGARRAPGAPPPRRERDVLRAELERLHLEVTHLRAKVRRRAWPSRLRRLFSRLGAGAAGPVSP